MLTRYELFNPGVGRFDGLSRDMTLAVGHPPLFKTKVVCWIPKLTNCIVCLYFECELIPYIYICVVQLNDKTVKNILYYLNVSMKPTSRVELMSPEKAISFPCSLSLQHFLCRLQIPLGTTPAYHFHDNQS